MRKRCKKKKFSKLEAMLHISRAELRNNKQKVEQKERSVGIIIVMSVKTII